MARWADLTEAGCTLIELPGDHHSILTVPQVDHLAAAITEQLRSPQGEGRPTVGDMASQ
jgi:hypothetical protein